MAKLPQPGFRGSDPDPNPGLWWQKTEKINTYFSWSNIAIYLFLAPGHPLRMSKLQEKPSANKRKHPALQNMKFLYLFYFHRSFMPGSRSIWNTEPAKTRQVRMMVDVSTNKRIDAVSCSLSDLSKTIKQYKHIHTKRDISSVHCCRIGKFTKWCEQKEDKKRKKTGKKKKEESNEIQDITNLRVNRIIEKKLTKEQKNNRQQWIYEWTRSSRVVVVRASGCQCQSRNSPKFDPSILRHSGIWGAADEAVLNNVH